MYLRAQHGEERQGKQQAGEVVAFGIASREQEGALSEWHREGGSNGPRGIDCAASWMFDWESHRW